MGKRSVARRQPGLGSSMTAVPQTAAIRASTGRRAQQPLRGSQREYAWQHPPTALAAELAFAARTRKAAMGTERKYKISIENQCRDQSLAGSTANEQMAFPWMALRSSQTAKALQAILSLVHWTHYFRLRLTDGCFVHQVCSSRPDLTKIASYPMVDLKSNKFCDDTDLVTNLDTKRNAHIKWAFATSLDGMDVGCAGKI